MIPFARGLALVMLLSSPSFAQIQVCDGRNHLNTTTSWTMALPAPWTLGVRFVPAATIVVERIEWFFGPNPAYTVLGGTQSVILEDPTTNLPSTIPIDVVAQGQWNGTTILPAWDGATFSAPILLQGGTAYWLTTRPGPTTLHQVLSCYGGGPDATSHAVALGSVAIGSVWVASTTPLKFKVRLMSVGSCSAGPIYQVNQLEASADVNGVQGSAIAPAEVTLAIGQAAVLTLSSSLTTVWDVGYGLAPLVPAGGGGLTLPDGKIVNLDLTDPTFNFLFAPPLSGPTFVISAIPVNTANPLALSFQMILLNPAAPTGVALSQANRLLVQ